MKKSIQKAAIHGSRDFLKNQRQLQHFQNINIIVDALCRKQYLHIIITFTGEIIDSLMINDKC